jgi:hypothetical protein
VAAATAELLAGGDDDEMDMEMENVHPDLHVPRRMQYPSQPPQCVHPEVQSAELVVAAKLYSHGGGLRRVQAWIKHANHRKPTMTKKEQVDHDQKGASRP